MRRRLLREEFRSGRLEAAESKAAMLSDLCDRLKYDQDAATEVHKGIYTERIETFLKDSKISGAARSFKLLQVLQQQRAPVRCQHVAPCSSMLPTGCGGVRQHVLQVRTGHTRASRTPADEEEQELATLRKLLCLPKEAVADIDTATKGRIFRTAVQSALGAGIDGFTQARSASIVQAQEGCVCVDPAPCCQRKANVPDLLMWRECPDCRRTARRCGRRGRRCGCPSTWPRRSSRTPPASAHAKAAVAEPQRQN